MAEDLDHYTKDILQMVSLDDTSVTEWRLSISIGFGELN